MRGKTRVVMIVDDEPETRKYVAMNLKARGYDIIATADGAEALKMFEERHIDLILLDITMPGPDGFQVCQHIRQVSSVPIIVLSARGRENDKVTALDLGADDYLTKPFGVRELVARVGSALRRSQGQNGSGEQRYEVGDLKIDLAARRILLKGDEVKLTPIEFSLLSLLVRNAGKVLIHRAILEAVWGGEYGEETEYVRAYVHRLRRKLGDDAETPSLILTEAGVGYRFADGALVEG